MDNLSLLNPLCRLCQPWIWFSCIAVTIYFVSGLNVTVPCDPFHVKFDAVHLLLLSFHTVTLPYLETARRLPLLSNANPTVLWCSKVCGLSLFFVQI